VKVLFAIAALAGLQAPVQDSPQKDLQRTIDTYAKAKSYQATWSYTSERGASLEKATIEIKWVPPAKLYYRVTVQPVGGNLSLSTLPELLVVVDGSTAYFENSTTHEFFQFGLPRNARIQPMTLFPLVPTTKGVDRVLDEKVGEESFQVFAAPRADGGTTRMYVAPALARFKQMTAEFEIGAMKSRSVIAVQKEAFDEAIPDSAFKYTKPAAGKQLPAPPGAQEIFGIAQKQPKP
jgi:outer membrane lipoprotein-sorting protein